VLVVPALRWRWVAIMQIKYAARIESILQG